MSTAATQAAMIEALLDDAIRREIHTNGRITSVTRFKTSVRESILDGERTHPGYIALCYADLSRRRAKDTPTPPRRPAARPLDDDQYTPADDYNAHRWNRLCVALSYLPADHDLQIAALGVGDSIRNRDTQRAGRTVTDLERDQDDHHARLALDALEQLALDLGVNLDRPGLPAFVGPPPALTPAQRAKQRGHLTPVADA